MATYISGSSVQADAMQTLYLMNPSYAGYTDSSNTGNLVLISPSTGVGQSNPLTSSSQQQQHYIGSLAQQFPITTIPNSGIGQQNPSANLFTSRIGNQAYHSWTEGGELSFLPSNDVTQVNPSLGGRITALNPGQHATLLQSGVALGLNMENTQASAGPGQGLSLSLSTQKSSVVQLQPYHMQHSESSISSCAGITHATSDSNTNRGERFPNKWVGNLSSFRASSRDGALGAAFQTSLNAAGSTRQVHLDSSAIALAGSGGLPFVSTYLRAAQQLLVEIVSVGRGLKNNSIKHIKTQSCVGTGPIAEVTVAKERTLSDSNGKDGVASAIAVPTVVSAPEQNTIAVPELSPVEKQELQMKKAKLMAMLDEVDRRFRQYYNQLQIVVASFEAAAGLGAAKTYTALALQTISRNFRCLRDAVSGQVRLTSRSLGDEDIAGQGMVKGETSRLRFVDQQLRQQRALQQLGIMQQHAWRPQRGLPERSVSVLRSWLFEHFLHPYPKDADKIMLARQTGLTRSQVSNWFINARVRLWKPMVEEMYTEESREAEMEATAEKAHQEGENTRKGIGVVDGAGDAENNPSLRQTKADANNRKVAPEQQNASDLTANKLHARNQTKNVTNSSCDTHIFHEDDGLMPGVKKSRSSLQDSGSLLSPNTSMDANLKSEEDCTEDLCDPANKLGRKSYTTTIPHGGQVHSENLGGFGSFHIGGLNRYSQEGLPARYPGSSGVSLTLGLQHCDGLSLSGAQQQQYMQAQALQTAGRRHDAGTASDVVDFYSMNNQSSGGHTSNYEAINQQNRKRFATHLLRQDFVA